MRVKALLLVCVAIGAVCGWAYAADLECTVVHGGAAVSGASLVLCPGGLTGTTAADGTYVFAGLAQGKYTVSARKIDAGTLLGALDTAVEVAATGTAAIKLELKEAVEIPPCFPLATGNEWHYATWHKDAAGAVSTGSRRERVVGTDTVGGESVAVIEVTDGAPGAWKQYQKTNTCGWRHFGEAMPTVTMLFEPPLGIHRILPKGQVVSMKTTVKSDDGSPDVAMSAQVSFVGFEPITVPAGSFNCARLDVVTVTGTEKTAIAMWIAPNVGTVRSYERAAHKEHRRSLERYSVRGVRALPTRPGPLVPTRPGGR